MKYKFWCLCILTPVRDFCPNYIFNISFLRAFQYMERFGNLLGYHEDEVEMVNEDASAVV